MLVTTKKMFEKSMKEGYAIGAFNVNNMEIIQGIVDAAAECHSPARPVPAATSGTRPMLQLSMQQKSPQTV